MKNILGTLIVLAALGAQVAQACPDHDAAGKDQQTSSPAPKTNT